MPSILVSRSLLTKPPAGSVIDLAHPQARGLIASWDMLDLDNFALMDSVPGGVSAILGGGMGWAASPQAGAPAARMSPEFGRSVQPNGGVDVIDAATNVRFDAIPFSVEMWLRTPIGYATAYAWAWGRDTSNTRHGWEFLLNTTAGTMLFVTRGGAGGAGSYSPAIANDGNWHHYVAGMSNPTYALWTDGVKAATATDAAFDYTGATSVRWCRSLDAFWAGLGAGVQFGPCRWRNYVPADDEVKRWYEEPFAMFRGPARRYWWFRTALVASRRRQNVTG